MSFPAFGELGVNQYEWCWLPENFEEAWAALGAADTAMALVRIGFPWDEIVVPARLVDQGDRLTWQTPESAYNAVLRLCELVPEVEAELIGMYRAAYPAELVAERFLDFLSRGPLEVPEHAPPVYLGRPQQLA